MMATSYDMLLSRETGFVAKVAERKADSQYVVGCRWKSREVAAAPCCIAWICSQNSDNGAELLNFEPICH